MDRTALGAPVDSFPTSTLNKKAVRGINMQPSTMHKAEIPGGDNFHLFDMRSGQEKQ